MIEQLSVKRISRDKRASMLSIIHDQFLHYICSMRVSLVLGVCLAFVFAVESFVEAESFEDEEENETGHHLKKVRWQLSVIKFSVKL